MRQYYPGLNGFRALAVGTVMASHCALGYPKSGSVGVDLFFVLSGFLITSILALEYEAYHRISVSNFYMRRALRLLPCLLLVCGTYAAVKYCFYGYVPGKTLAIVFTYTSNWARALYSFNLHSLAHTWSLSAEEQFYIFWPFVILCLERTSRSARTKGFFLATMALASAVYRASVVRTFSVERVHYGLDTHMDGLLLGTALAYLVLEMRKHGGLSGKQSHLLGRVLAPFSLAVVFAALAVSWKNPWMEYIGGVVTSGMAAILILDIVLGRHSLLKPIFEIRPLMWAGQISYGLYLWHPPIYRAVDRLMGGTSRLYTTPVKIILSVGVAALSFYLVENRFLRLKKIFSSRKAAKKSFVEVPSNLYSVPVADS